ncbi:MAG: methylated-DNA--[protein]-cysteine S-methyltransferase [Deltaproteobacteria bacterium]|nr:methylated-DNA--[protein]-cysteine S-methyltransferase [Deltaproteobacteria bacterium]
MKTQWRIAANPRGVTKLALDSGSRSRSALSQHYNEARRRAVKELRDYFAGRRQAFSVPCDLSELTPFTQKVLSAAAKIPYGQVRSYKWLAERLGKPKAARAVGNALARNPVPILIPCHRVVRRDGAIGRFVLGSGWKKRLLELEKRFAKTEASLNCGV